MMKQLRKVGLIAMAAAVAGADIVMPQVSGSLFATEDLQNAVQTFLKEGPGHATFEGR